MTESESADLQKRVIEINDELRGLADDAFGEKYVLLSERDRVRAALADLNGAEMKAAGKDWADRAGRKGSHTFDPEQLKAMIVSPNEGGGTGT